MKKEEATIRLKETETEYEYDDKTYHVEKLPAIKGLFLLKIITQKFIPVMQPLLDAMSGKKMEKISP